MAIDFAAHVRTESDRFAAALRDADPSARVPSCPDWSAADLLWHLTEVHHLWAEVVAGRITDGAAVEGIEAGTPPRPDDLDELHDLRARTTDAMLDALAGAGDDEPVWTWSTQQDVGFVRRFQAHEATIHRVDAELTAGRDVTPLPVELAEDGIDVVLRFAKTWRPGWADWQVSDEIGRVHATDTGREWTLRLGSWSGRSPDSGTTYDARDAIELTDGGTIGAGFTVSAPAADLNAWLWQRPGFAEVTVTGGPGSGAERFRTLAQEGMP